MRSLLPVRPPSRRTREGGGETGVTRTTPRVRTPLVRSPSLTSQEPPVRRLLALLVLPALVAACQSGTGHDHHGEGDGGGGRTRIYYVSSDEVPWDYAPSGHNLVTGLAFTPEQQVFVQRARDRIGSRYLKCLY